MMSAYDHNEKGLAYFEQGQYQKAIEEFKKVLKVDQNHAMAWYSMGLTYGELDEYDTALECYRKAVKIALGYAEA